MTELTDMASQVGLLAQLNEAISLFKCDLDDDIGSFLRNKANNFETNDICRVYVILNSNDLLDKKFTIDAYFTLSYKSLQFQSNLSKSKRQHVTGKKDSLVSSFTLIGQLGKYIEIKEDGTYLKSSITSKEILDFAFDIIRENNARIPCKYVLVEIKFSENDNKVIQKYSEYGFEFFQDDDKFHHYIKKL